MMPKYVKKPVIVEAFQLTKNNIQNPGLWPDWLQKAFEKNFTEYGAVRRDVDKNLLINTLEGTLTAIPGDYIICGIRGELYPCRADIFKKIYEEADKG